MQILLSERHEDSRTAWSFSSSLSRPCRDLVQVLCLVMVLSWSWLSLVVRFPTAACFVACLSSAFCFVAVFGPSCEAAEYYQPAEAKWLGSCRAPFRMPPTLSAFGLLPSAFCLLHGRLRLAYEYGVLRTGYGILFTE